MKSGRRSSAPGTKSQRHGSLSSDCVRAFQGVDGVRPEHAVQLTMRGKKSGESVVLLIAEFTGSRVDDVERIRDQMAAALQKIVGTADPRVEIVRPGWLPTTRHGALSHSAAHRKYVRMQALRKTSRLSVGGFEDNISEKQKDCFLYFGHDSKVRPPIDVYNPGRTHIGNWVSLGRYGSISLHTDFTIYRDYIAQHYPDSAHDLDLAIFGPRDPYLKIGDGTYIGDQFLISCGLRVEIGRHVCISSRLFIGDVSHIYDRPDLPIQIQGVTMGRPVVIEDHACIGINCCILEGVRIGKHSVIGANSVVTRDIPAFCVAVGSPAKPIKKIR